jgi:acetoin utilization deacetylase AcuC-like enzyme
MPCRVHTAEYVAKVQACSQDEEKGVHSLGDMVTISPGGFDIAALSAGGALTAVDAVMAGECQNAYALVRPPGHHAGTPLCTTHNYMRPAVLCAALRSQQAVSEVTPLT